MLKSILFVLGLLATGAFIFGCTKVESTVNATSFEECVKAGYPVLESHPRQCRTPEGKSFAEESCMGMGFEEAKQIAIKSDCGDRLIVNCSCPEGYMKEGEACNPKCYYNTPKCLQPSVACQKSYFCNTNSQTWWIDLNISKQGCSPACVIFVENKTAEINWRCTGLRVPPTEQTTNNESITPT
jgi:hypothetical protein